jgi:hypothetical protein
MSLLLARGAVRIRVFVVHFLAMRVFAIGEEV